MGSQTYQYFILLFFTLSVEGGRGKVNDKIFTLSVVFFILMASLSKYESMVTQMQKCSF